ncbi:MAG: single-stranded DNA-binding protein [Cyclobacteriaceae bacterium]
MISKNNEVTLIGNIGAEPKVIDKNDKLFVVFSLATQDSYKDDNDEWQKKDPIWHNNLLAFNTSAINKAKELSKGERIRITGSLSYRPFETTIDGDKTVNKNEASIIVASIEKAPL